MLSKHTNFDSNSLGQILEISKKLNMPSYSLDKMLSTVLNLSREILQTERGTVFLFDSEHNELYVRVGTKLKKDEIRFPASYGIAGACASSRTIINVLDAYTDKRFNPEVDRKTGFTTRCILSVPLIDLNDNLIGILQLINKKTGSFTHKDEKLAEILASQCAVALEYAQLLENYLTEQKSEITITSTHEQEIRKSLLPKKMPIIPGYEIVGWNKPTGATETAIFDAAQVAQGKILFLLADSVENGLTPALTVIEFRAMIKIALDLTIHTPEVTTKTVFEFEDNNLLTAFIGILDSSDDFINYHSIGGTPLLHYHASGCKNIELLPISSLPLGIDSNFQLDEFNKVKLQKGDIFSLISEGIFKQTDNENKQFGIDKMVDLINKNANLEISELIKLMHTTVAEFSENFSYEEDLTILLIKRI